MVFAEVGASSGLVFENGQKTIEGFNFKDIKPEWSQSYSAKITNPTDVKTTVNLLLKNPNDTSLLKYFTIVVNNNELSLETLSQQSLSLGELPSKEVKNYDLLFKSQNLVESLQEKTLTFDLELVGSGEMLGGLEGVGGLETAETAKLTTPRNFIANLVAKLPVLGTTSSLEASTSGSNSANIVNRSPILMAIGILVVFAFIGGIVASFRKAQ